MGGKSSSVTTGYKYRMGLHFGICHGPVDNFSEIRVGERTAWAGNQTVSGPITIDAPKLFGGDSREGGIAGSADVMMGEPSQVANTYLASKIDGLMPAFRGILGLVYKGGLVASNNPYVKPWAFKLRRITKGWGGFQVTDVTEYSNDVLYPWAEGSNDPRACKNDHEYRKVGGTWRGTLEEAIADVEATIGATLSDTLIGWSKEYSSAGLRLVSPYTEIDPEERETLYLHFNRHTDLIDPSRFFATLQAGTGDVCGAFPASGISPGDDYFWWQYQLDSGIPPTAFNAGTTAGIFGHSIRYTGDVFDPVRLPGIDYSNNCTANGPPPGDAAPNAWVVNDEIIEVRRIVRAPDDPCSPRCDDPFPDYEPDSSFCVIDTSAIKRGGWTLTAGNYKVLQNYAISTGVVVEYPMGPVIPDTDPTYSDEAFWTAQYDASVLNGTSRPGKSFDADGDGDQASTYPIYVDAAYVRDGGSIVEGEPWQPDYATVGDDMNPAHIIYQCLTDERWGMGYPVALIDEAAFLSAATALTAEEFGLSLLWNQQSKIGEFIQIVLDHIGGVLYADPKTGKFVLKLIRADYDPETLEVFDENNVVQVASFQRAGYGETVNEITVVYTDAITDKDTPITVQDLANIQAQGSVVSQTKQYPGIRFATLAARVAERDLIAGSVPLARIQLKVNRSAWSKVTGDVIKLSWAKLGLEEVICRVLAVNYGTLTDGMIIVDVSEDVFGLPDSSYAEQEPGGWVEPDVTADDIDPADVLEAPYWDVSRSLSAADLDYTDPDAAYILTLGARGNPIETNYRIWARISPAEYENTNVGDFAPTALIEDSLGADETTDIGYTFAESIDDVEVGCRALIGTGRDAEWAIVQAIDTVAGSISLARGILDTTPKYHPEGTRIWFVDDSMGFDTTERATAEELNFKLTAVAPGGESDIEDATELSIEPDQRFFRPYPPGNVAINGEAFPALLDSALTVTWSHRDRIQQTAGFIEQDEGDIGPEAGTTYSAFAYDDLTDVLLDTDTGISGTTWSPEIASPHRLRIEIASVRDGLESWQRQVRIFDYTVDVRLMEDGAARLTESGIFREEE